MHKLRNYLLITFAVVALAITLAVTGLGSKVMQAAPPDRGPWPYQERFDCLISAGSNDCSDTLTVVPAGKRLVVEYVSAHACLNATDPPAATMDLGGSQFHYLALGAPNKWFGWTCRTVSQQMLGFVEAGASVTVWYGAGQQNAVTDSPIEGMVSGHLEPAP